ncbi:thiolase family protein [Bradyrhizobium sp. UFLA05-109]
MARAAIVGAAMSPFGKRPEVNLWDLGWPVVKAAMRDAGLDREAVNAVYAGSAFSDRLVGQRIVRSLGMLGIPVVNCENACSSGGTAFREAVRAVEDGHHDVVLVIGIDKLTALGGGVLPGQAEDWEVAVGLTMPALYAMRARRYMHEYGVSAERLSAVPVKAHRHGALNPYAQFRNEVTVDEVLAARQVADPFTVFHCCPTGDGAAAVVVASEAYVKRHGCRPVWVVATELNSGKFLTGFRDMTLPEITARGAVQIYEEAGLGPDDIDVAEVHDAFSVAELFYYEALGFCGRGEGIGLLETGATSIGGRIPINPSGGLLCKGHPVGATGVAQLVEITWQLRGEAGARQVEDARTGLTHCTGGGIAGLDHGACTINILAR